MDDEQASANVEMRYLTVELMRLAARRKASFNDVANEFIENVYTLESLVRKKTAAKTRAHSKGVALGGKAARERQI